MALNFGQHEDVVFNHAPLKMVLCQVRFPPILSLLANAGVVGFQTALRRDYPVTLQPSRNTNIAVGTESIGVQASPPVWRLTDDTGKWTIGIAVDFISLETPNYVKIDEFLERFTQILEVLQRTIRPGPSIRVGLRKINLITLPATAHREAYARAIRAELLGPVAIPDFPTALAQFASIVSFVDDENLLQVQAGLSQDEESKGFVLDMDYSTEKPYSFDSAGNIISLLRYFSDGMTSFFHWALLDDYKTGLEPSARSDGG